MYFCVCLCLSVVLEACYACFSSSVFICVFFDCKCKSLNRLGENKHKHRETNIKQKSFENQHKTTRNTGYPAHEPPRIYIVYLFAQVRGLDILYLCCLLRFFSKLFCFFLFCMFSPSRFKLLHLQSNNTHIKETT